MPTFTPPATERLPVDYFGDNDKYFPSDALLRRLMRHYQGNLRAPNVYKLTDGSYTTAQPADEDSISTVYLGSHTYVISEDAAAALVAAGYSPVGGYTDVYSDIYA